MWRAFPLAGLMLCAMGCFSSKWAMDDPDYSAKYSKPYPDDHFEKSKRMAKQMVDARHAAGEYGLYGGMAFADAPTSVGLEVGGFDYATSWLSSHISLSYLAGTGAQDLFTGANAGLRMQIPSRLSPFVGTGVYGGYSEETVTADCGCKEEQFDGAFAAVYPEVGMHLWLNGHWRLTTSAAYYFNTEGRDQDFWLFGISLGRLTSSDKPEDEESNP